ncbi:MAG TPA: glycoside hydrolase family 3 protein [Candidatus Limnocylindrales bacterium]
MATTTRRSRGAPAPAGSIEGQVGQRLLRTFAGRLPDRTILDVLRGGRAAGVTLFRADNIESPAQVRAMTAALQAARAPGDPPFLIAVDQEGGQLQAIDEGATRLPGNLALGAIGSTELARRAGNVLGRELAAMGVNVAFAPVCDLLADGLNPAVGPRSFGADPTEVGRLAAAMTVGIQETGVAATLKHFPGHGATSGDSHVGLPVIDRDAAALRSNELPPFAAGIAAGARLVMLAHLAAPALTGGHPIAATLARPIAHDLLRGELGFAAVSVTDALNMGAIGQGHDLFASAVDAVSAGNDLILLAHDPATEDAIHAELVRALRDGRLDPLEMAQSNARVRSLRGWLGGARQPGLDVVGCTEHLAVAREIAERSVTLVRDHAGLLPLRPAAGERIAVVACMPVDLTPADTSSFVRLALVEAIARRHPRTDEVTMSLDPTPGEVDAIRLRVAGASLVVVATFDALNHRGQAVLVERLTADGRPVVAVALRAPFDLEAYPSVTTYACTYGVQRPSVEALAAALFAEIPFSGRLPVPLAI